jgi:peptidoglycan-N-acetylglucosamine deacetylase
VSRLHPATAALALALLGGGAAGASPACGPQALGTARTLTLPRSGAAWGSAQQYARLPLAPGEVVLTFDDGPRPESTPQVLQALAQQCVQATFFMNGEPLLRAPELARRVRDAGHTVAMHGFTHTSFAEMPLAAQQADLAAMQQAYTQVLGGHAPAFRFPFLAETAEAKAALAAERITVMSVDLGVEDWLPAQTPSMLAERLLQRLQGSGGGIVLLHDAQDQTAAALPALLRALKDGGYRVVHLRWEE